MHPNMTASNINNNEVVATAPFADDLTTSPVVALFTKPLKVPATTSAKAAITKIQNSQQNAR